VAGCPLLPRPPSEGKPPLPTLEPISVSYGGLLTRLDILVNLVADRRGLALDLQGRLAAAEGRLLAEALELDRSPGPAPRDLAAVELLRGIAEAIGLLRDRGDRVEATTLRHPWAQLDPDLRAGLVYAAWCHRVPWAEMLGDVPEPHVRKLRDARTSVLRLLFDLPAGVEVHLAAFAATVADRAGLPDERWLNHTVAAVFLDPLVALGAADVAPPHPEPPGRCRLGPAARTIIGSALIAAGEDVPRDRAPMN
jgi:hypothetical protein